MLRSLLCKYHQVLRCLEKKRKASVWVVGGRDGLSTSLTSGAIDLEQALGAQRDMGEKVFIGAINEPTGEIELFL